MAPLVVRTTREDAAAAGAGAAFTRPEAALWLLPLLQECQRAVGTPAAAAGEILRDLQKSRQTETSASGSEPLACN